jgi:general secretion pathway protein I
MSARRQRGFTLLEVMVAFVLLAVALGLLLSILSRGLQQISRAQAETEATLHAQSLLDAIGTLETIEPGIRDGEFDRGKYRWRLQVSESPDPAPPPPPADGSPLPQAVETSGAPLLYRIALEVEWGNRQGPQKLRFDTLRLRAPAGEIGASP